VRIAIQPLLGMTVLYRGDFHIDRRCITQSIIAIAHPSARPSFEINSTMVDVWSTENEPSSSSPPPPPLPSPQLYTQRHQSSGMSPRRRVIALVRAGGVLHLAPIVGLAIPLDVILVPTPRIHVWKIPRRTRFFCGAGTVRTA
jgi:hypothetical protein